MALYEAVGIARDDHDARLGQMLKNFRFFGAPHVAVITSPRALGAYGVMDCGAYVANLLNLAQALGLGAIAQGAIGMYADAVRRHLPIDDDRDVVCAVSVGHADPDHPGQHLPDGARRDRPGRPRPPGLTLGRPPNRHPTGLTPTVTSDIPEISDQRSETSRKLGGSEKVTPAFWNWATR